MSQQQGTERASASPPREGNAGAGTARAADPVQAHYDALLARHYDWMCGDVMQRIADTAAWFRAHEVVARGPQRALDLGCGSGMQAIALAHLGFAVTAVDLNPLLLESVRERGAGLDVTTILADLADPAWQPGAASRFDVVVCMGDTLTHLPAHKAVDDMFARIGREWLAAGGSVVIAFRDLSRPLTGPDRILPVRVDDPDKVMLTVLDYEPDLVQVHDIVLTKDESGWRLEKGRYPKLRLSEDGVTASLRAAGLDVRQRDTVRGMLHLVAGRPAE